MDADEAREDLPAILRRALLWERFGSWNTLRLERLRKPLPLPTRAGRRPGESE